MPIRKITIHNVCKTTPQQARIGGSTGFDEVQWRGTSASSFYTLQLPGGVFIDHPNPFTLDIVGSNYQPDPPLKLVPNPPPTLISRYVFDKNGVGCAKRDPPPEIVIEARFSGKRKTQAKGK